MSAFGHLQVCVSYGMMKMKMMNGDGCASHLSTSWRRSSNSNCGGGHQIHACAF